MDEHGRDGAPGRDGASGEQDLDTLRAKYYDYCSARVADVLLGMTPDQIFVVAEAAASARGLNGPLGYERMVGLATEHISRQLGLPSFAHWTETYRRDPESIERRLLGLWESAPLPETAGSPDD